MSRTEDLARIRAALDVAADVLANFESGSVSSRSKGGSGPVTEADLLVDAALRDLLPAEGEGWLSEETVDDPRRLSCRRTWIVDPIDGTREFVKGVPDWCVSVALVEDGRPVAGGILAPDHGQLFLGGSGQGVTLDGRPVRATRRDSLPGSVVLASRSEVRRGEWTVWSDQEGLTVEPTGSVAYKLALVAAGLADATWTLAPKQEWDVAGGAALVLAAGGAACLPDGRELRFNQPDTELPGLLACARGLQEQLVELLTQPR